MRLVGPSIDVYQTTVGWSDPHGSLHMGEVLLLRGSWMP